MGPNTAALSGRRVDHNAWTQAAFRRSIGGSGQARAYGRAGVPDMLPSFAMPLGEVGVINAAITGWGKCLPPAVLSNQDLTTLIETSDDWIVSRTGIRER